MMKDNISSEATKARITIPETVAGLLGIIMIAFWILYFHGNVWSI